MNDEDMIDVEASFLTDDLYEDDMDGDAESALASIGWGLDESYGHFNDNGDY